MLSKVASLQCCKSCWVSKKTVTMVTLLVAVLIYIGFSLVDMGRYTGNRFWASVKATDFIVCAVLPVLWAWQKRSVEISRYWSPVILVFFFVRVEVMAKGNNVSKHTRDITRICVIEKKKGNWFKIRDNRFLKTSNTRSKYRETSNKSAESHT